MDDLHVKVEDGVKTLTIRQGEALPLHETKDLVLTGTLQAPGDFLDKRKDQFHKDETHITVDDDAGRITLETKDQDEIGMIRIIGVLKNHPDLERLGVNNPDSERSPKELAKFIRMNRTMFESKDVAMNLVADLMSFTAKVDKYVEEIDDDRANFSRKRQQAVETNIPAAFKVNIPLFIGSPKSSLVIEVVIDPDTLDCALISPDAADKYQIDKADMLGAQIKRFNEFAVIYT